jgi:hypothetical protein
MKHAINRVDKRMNHDSENQGQRSDLSARDAELAARLAQTLQNSTDALDADTRARLAAMRHQALTRSRTKRLVGGLALAASVLAIVSMPWMLRQQAHEKVADDAAYLSVDPEMLADMDMLQAIGEIHE